MLGAMTEAFAMVTFVLAVSGLRWWIRSRGPTVSLRLTRAIQAAVTLAQRRGQVVGVPHVFAVALYDDEVVEAVTAGAGVLAEARRSISGELSGEVVTEANAIGRPLPSALSPTLRDLLAVARRRAFAQRRDLELSDVLACQLLDQDAPSSTILATLQFRWGSARTDFPPVVTTARGYRSALAPAARVVFWNDDRTPMDTVTSILQSCFGRDEPEALLRMLEVHQEGHAFVGTWAKDEARARVADAERIVAKAGFPLRITVEEIEEAE